MKKEKWGKYRTNRSAKIISIIIDVVMLILYIISLLISEKTDSKSVSVILNVISNFLLVGISVLSASLLSVPLIEVRDKNEMYKKHILLDVFSSPDILEVLTRDQKEQLLKCVESNLYFDNNKMLSEMLLTVRNKIWNNSGNRSMPQNGGSGLYFEKCSYEIECTLENGMLKKSILKKIDLRSYEKQTITGFLLCSSTSENAEDGKFSEIEGLFVNSTQKNIKECVQSAISESASPFSKKCGYSKNIKYMYKKSLSISPVKPTKIALTHRTMVPETDTAFSCRLKYPCHNFEFRFSLKGEAAKYYNLNVNAFGFLEDGGDTPNRTDPTTIKVAFNNWIFPYDGVSVSLVKKTKPLD